MNKFKTIVSAIILIVTFVFVMFLMFTKIMGKTPEIFGYQILRISSPSMEPELNVGDIILSQRVDDVSVLRVGDIITYSGEVGDYSGKMITHEVVTAPHKNSESDNTYYLQTKGSANEYDDPEIRDDQVIGIMKCKLTVLSTVYGIFITPWGLFIVLGFLAVLFINEAFALRQLVKENEDEKRKDQKGSSNIAVDDETGGNN